MIRQAIDRAAATLWPGYFALVMATGIVSIALLLLEVRPLAVALLVINVVAYAALWLLTLVRLARHFPAVWADLRDYGRGPGFFTLVAASCVLGNQLVLVRGEYGVALVLWGLALALWLVVMYAFFFTVTVREDKPPLERGLHGGWLLAIVATQALSALGSLLAPQYASQRDILLFFALCLYLLGAMLYLPIITLIFYRFTFFSLSPTALTPPYWINMGAMAITTLAGASLLLRGTGWPLIAELAPFLKGFTLFFWSAGSWWIPLLFLLGAWRHLYRRFPLQYDPQYWGLVFPLGMYTTATFQLARALELSFLLAIPRAFGVMALIAWTIVFVGLLRHLVTSLATLLAPRRAPR